MEPNELTEEQRNALRTFLGTVSTFAELKGLGLCTWQPGASAYCFTPSGLALREKLMKEEGR